MRAKKLNSDAIIHDVDRVDDYPNSSDEEEGISSWFRVGLLETYHRGVKVGLRIGSLVETEKGLRFADHKNKEKGKTPNMIYKMWKDLYGQEVADAVAQSKRGDILGPLAGKNGFEIIKIKSKRELKTTPFEEAKDRIVRQNQRSAGEENRKKVLEEIKANAIIEKSPELIELEKQSKGKEREMRPPGGRRPGKMPRRR